MASGTTKPVKKPEDYQLQIVSLEEVGAPLSKGDLYRLWEILVQSAPQIEEVPYEK